MPKGVNKIKFTGGSGLPLNGGTGNVILQGGKRESFQVSEWAEGTTKEDKGKVVWFLEDSKRTRIIKTYPGTGDLLHVTIPKKLSGNSALYYLEAAVTGKPDKSKMTGLLIRGYSPEIIVSSKWSIRPGGDNIKNKTPVSYGQPVFLYLDTEGLNGASLIVEVYNRQLGEDRLIRTYPARSVVEGEFNLEMPDTRLWMGKVRNIQKTEDFYVKVKHGNTYLVDKLGEYLHAVYLKIDNQVYVPPPAPKQNNSPAKIGAGEPSQNSFEHCKYTAVVIREDKREVKVFDEKAKGSGLITPFEIVAGEGSKGKKKFSITLEGEDISRCKAKTKHQKGTVFTYDEATKKWVTKASEKELELEIAYDYGTATMVTGAAALQYLWPRSAGVIQKHTVKASTCRYQKNIPISIFPDIEWELNFEYAAENPVFYGDSWKKMTRYRIDDAWNKTQAASLDGYNGKFQTEFSLVLAAKWNGGTSKTELGAKYAKTIADFLGVFMKAKRMADTLSHRDLADSVVLNQLLKNPFTMQIDYPKVAIGVGWKLETNPNAKQKAVVMAEGKIGFYPLLSGAGRLDLLALSEKLPVVGQVINALEWTADILRAKPKFELAAIGEINVGIELKKNFAKSTTDFEVAVSGKFGLRIELSLKASGKIDAVIFAADYMFEASGVAESYFLPKVSGGSDDLGAYINGNLDFSGVTIILIIKGTFGKSSRSKEVKFEIVEKKENILKGQYYFIRNK